MAKCTRPLYALDLGVKENGKRNIKILPRRVDLSSMKQLEARYGKAAVLPLPCGTCLACRLNHAKEWAVRCVLEAMYYEENYFVTLTYDDDHIPSDLMLHRGDFVDFMKRLRYHAKGKVRYFACGEYGTKNKRPHFHVILFGLKLDDLKPIGNGLYESKTMAKIWPYGYHYIGEVSYSSCNYVARYATKKVFNDQADEFIAMSSHPGLGYQWLKDHIDTTFEYDSIYGNFGNSKAVKLPRYFDKIAESLDNAKFFEVKGKRLDKSTAFTFNELINHAIDEVEKLYKYKEGVLMAQYANQRKGSRL